MDMLHSLSTDECLHICIESWGAIYVCIDCKPGNKYLNFDDGKEVANPEHVDNLGIRARDDREREIEAEVNREIEASFIQNLCAEEQKNELGKASAMRGIPIGWLVDFTNENDCWDMKTQEVCKRFIFPATAARRCRYVELDFMQGGIVGQASTFISHCRGGTWGDLVAAVCDGDADRSRRVWIDIFACRQWPSKYPDMGFDACIKNCSSLLVVVSSLEVVAKIESFRAICGDSKKLLPKYVRDMIAFLRVWCLVEIYAAIENHLPIVVRGGKCKKNADGSFKFEPNYEMLNNLRLFIDINKAEATRSEDYDFVINRITGNEKDAATREKKIKSINVKVSSAIFASMVKVSSTVQNAACGDKYCLDIVKGKFADYFIDYCTGGYLKTLIEDFCGDPQFANLVGQRGNTALMMACSGGHKDIVELLIRKDLTGQLIRKTNNNSLSALINACMGNHLDIVELLIDKDPSMVHHKDVFGFTAFMAACKAGNIDIIHSLLRVVGEDNICSMVCDTTENGTTSLMIASLGGNINIVKLLIDNDKTGKLIYYERNDGCTAFMEACLRGHLDIVQLMTKMDANVIHSKKRDETTTFMLACDGGNIEIIKLMIAMDETLINKTRMDGCTALMGACYKGHADIVELLINKKANVFGVSSKGFTAFTEACYGGQINIVNLLIKEVKGIMNHNNGSDVGFTAFMAACSGGHIDIVKLLIDKDATGQVIYDMNSDGQTAFIEACKGGYIEIIKHLINMDKTGKIIHNKRNDGTTAFMEACRKGRLDVVKLLVAHDTSGIIHLQKNVNGETPFIFACTNNGTYDVVDYLIKLDASKDPSSQIIRYKRDDGTTAFWLACKHGKLASVKLLLNSDRSVTKERSNSGSTGFLEACSNGHLIIVKWLLEMEGELINDKTDDGRCALEVARMQNHVDIVKYLEGCYKREFGVGKQYLAK